VNVTGVYFQPFVMPMLGVTTPPFPDPSQ